MDVLLHAETLVWLATGFVFSLVSMPVISVLRGKKEYNLFVHLVMWKHRLTVYRERYGFSYRIKGTSRYYSKQSVRVQATILELITRIIVIVLWPSLGWWLSKLPLF